MFKLPGPAVLNAQLQEAIRKDMQPSQLLYQFLSNSNGSMASNYIANTLLENKLLLRTLSSPEGRRWIHKWFDNFLDYLQQLSQT